MLSPRAAAFGVEALLKSSGQCSKERSTSENYKSKHTKDSEFVCSLAVPRDDSPTESESTYADQTKSTTPLNHHYFQDKTKKTCSKRPLELHEVGGESSAEKWPRSLKKLKTSNCPYEGGGNPQTFVDHLECKEAKKDLPILLNQNKYKSYSCTQTSSYEDKIKRWPQNAQGSSSNEPTSSSSANSTSDHVQQPPQRSTIRQHDPGPMSRREIKVALQHRSLWDEFHQHQTEMIVTKNGRRMFPVIKIRVEGLKPDTSYMIYMDIMPVDGKRYRYAYLSSTWVVAGTGDVAARNNAVYIHPESPATGSRWMDMPSIAFDKLKLTNNRSWDSKGQIYLQSMQKYLPRIWIQSLESREDETKNCLQDTSMLRCLVDRSRSICFSFPETSFITVTAYQNQKITRLKINTNPFAKGFRDNSKYKNSTEHLISSPNYGMSNHGSQYYSFGTLSPHPSRFVSPGFHSNSIFPFLPSCHLRPSISNRWPLFPPMRPANDVISSFHSYLCTPYHRNTNGCQLDTTKERNS